MPELPEVETVVRRLRKPATGRTIVAAHIDRPQTTKPASPRLVAQKLTGQKIKAVERRAKNVLLRFADGMTLRIHFRMTGNLWIADPKDRPSSVRAWFTLDDGKEIVYVDSRLLGHMELLSPEQFEKFSASIGVEPLSPEFTREWLAKKASRSRKPAKLFLMDQTIIAGLGNIWAAEALFAARISPLRAMNSLSRRNINVLHDAIVEILNGAVKSAYRKYTAPGETSESDGFEVAVYNREGQPCLRCRRRVKRIPQGGRSTYFCSGCQR